MPYQTSVLVALTKLGIQEVVISNLNTTSSKNITDFQSF
ncbi:hypothetical protein AEQU3_03318 [Aequorivita antarctica]|nr:hypothetical protein AEQU3_03318 [Aequorivita antarctica]